VGITSGVSVNASDQPASDTEFGVLKTSAVQGGKFFPEENKKVWDTEIERLSCPVTSNTVIISRMNTPALVGESGYVERDYPRLFLPDRLWKIEFDTSRVYTKYMAFVISSKEARHALAAMATGTSPSMKNLSQEEMVSLHVPLPGLAEQYEICKYIEKMSMRISLAKDELNASMTLLKERRAALITAAITGQLDLEEMAA